MIWQELLKSETARLSLPWLGGKAVYSCHARYTIQDPPNEFGWYEWSHGPGRSLVLEGPSAPDFEQLVQEKTITGYLMGDYLVPDQVQSGPTIRTLTRECPKVYLVDEGLDRFSRIAAAPTHPGMPLVYVGQVFPLGPEPEVLDAYLDRKDAKGIKGITPALYAAFQLETHQRDTIEKRRAEIARLQKLEEERLAQEALRKELVEKLGSAQKRRELAVVDFEQAAKAALEVGGATYLDSRTVSGNEMAVRFRYQNRRFECTCDKRTLRLISAGICLSAHHDDDDFAGGTVGDTWLTLESLPSVIKEAIDTGRLVVFRHA